MTQSGEPAFDKREQLEQIRSGLMDGEQIYAVYDATGAGTGSIAATDKRVILQDKSFAGKKVALVSLPYSRITSVAVTSNKSHAQQQATEDTRLEDTRRSLQRAATVPPTSRRCNDQLSPP